MKHMHHQQVLRPPSHHRPVGASPPPTMPQQPLVMMAHQAPLLPLKQQRQQRSSIELNFFGLIGLFFVFLFVIYVLAMAFAPQLLLGSEDETIGPDGHIVHLRHSHGGHRHHAQPDEGSCISLLEQERRAKATLLEQLKQTEAELTEEKRKYRELEREYRDLSLSARAQQQQMPGRTTANMEADVSALQRLAKCHQSLDERTQTIKDLRDHNKGLDAQVTRLQKELREAIADADEQERVAMECERRLKKLSGSKVPPPPPLD